MRYLKVLMVIVLIYTLALGSSMSAYALEQTYHLTVFVDEGSIGMGTVSVVYGELGFAKVNTGSIDIVYTDDLSIEATPNPGYKFVKWEVNFGDGSFNDPPVNFDYKFTCNLSHCGPYTPVVELRAKFEPLPDFDVNITVKDETTWGSVIGMGAYKAGDLVTLKAVPSLHYSLYDWEGPDYVEPEFNEDGDEVTFIMPNQDVEITVSFKEDFFVMATIQYVNASNMSIKTETNEKVYLGAYTLQAPVISGYTFDSTTNGAGTITEESVAFTVIHKYVATPPATEPVTQPVTEPTTAAPTTATATTEASSEAVAEEEVPLAVPEPVVVQNDPILTTEELAEVVGEEEIPLAVTLPQTGQLPADYFFGIGGIISGLGLWLKRRK